MRCKHIGRGGCRPERITKAIHGSTFEIDASEKGSGYALLAFPEQAPGLLRSLNVAREQHNAGRLEAPEQGSNSGIDFDAIESDDEQLPRVLQKFPPVLCFLNLFFQFR
jgi:hypothetical protein